MKVEAELLEQVMQRPAPERARIAAALLRSLEEEEDPDADEAWDEELQRRIADLDSGAVKPITLEEFETEAREWREAAAARAKRG